MITPEEIQRIEKAASDHALTRGYVNHIEIRWCKIDYIAGALAERPIARNKVIDECISIFKKTALNFSSYGLTATVSEVEKKLEALKHKQS